MRVLSRLQNRRAMRQSRRNSRRCHPGISANCSSHTNELVPGSNRARLPDFKSSRFILHAVNHNPSIPRRAPRSCPANRPGRLFIFIRVPSLHLFCTMHIPTSVPCVRCKLDAAVAPTIKDDQSRRVGKLASARSCTRLP